MSTFFVVWKITSWIIRVLALVIVPSRRPPAQARAWLFFFLLLPIPAAVAYQVFGRVFQPKRLAKLRSRVSSQLRRASEQWNDTAHVEEPPLPEALHSVAHLATNLSHFPIMRGNAMEIFDTHPESEDALIRDIDHARHHVHLLYYTFENDKAGQRVSDAICRAAQRGVKCRVLMDAVGAASGLKHLRPQMLRAGAEVVEIQPVRFFARKTARYDLRNHRKIAVFDGKVAHVGSANIIEPEVRCGNKCQEIVVRVRGPVVSQLQVVLLADRYLEVEDKLDAPDLFPPIDEDGNVHAHVLPSGPLHTFSHTRKVLTSLIHNASRRVVVTTPYFVPDATYLNAMQAAALGGVEVRLIVPRRSDNLMVTYAQESFFDQLMEAGVHVHCYKPGLLHSKMITVDGEIAVVGSANMDIRSLDLNREISMLIYDRDVVADLEKVERRYLCDSVEISTDEWAKRTVGRRFLQNSARLFDSFL